MGLVFIYSHLGGVKLLQDANFYIMDEMTLNKALEYSAIREQLKAFYLKYNIAEIRLIIENQKGGSIEFLLSNKIQNKP